MNTVGTMLVEEPAPAPPTISSVLEQVGAAFSPAHRVPTTQTRAGNDVAPSQMNLRGSASMLGWPIIAWLGEVAREPPITVPSRGACA